MNAKLSGELAESDQEDCVTEQVAIFVQTSG